MNISLVRNGFLAVDILTRFRLTRSRRMYLSLSIHLTLPLATADRACLRAEE
jgi:hypothetical protein